MSHDTLAGVPSFLIRTPRTPATLQLYIPEVTLATPVLVVFVTRSVTRAATNVTESMVQKKLSDTAPDVFANSNLNMLRGGLFSKS